MKTGTAFLDQRTVALLVLAGGIVAGIPFPAVTAVLQPFALPALFLVVVFSLIPFSRLPLNELLGADRSVLRLVAWQQLFLPCLVISAGVVARFPDSIITLMIVTACAGSLFASPMLAELLHLDRRHAVQCMVLSTLAMPIALYCWLSVYHGVSVPLNLSEYLRRTAIFLAVPFGMIALYRLVVTFMPHAYTPQVENVSRWGSVLSLLVFGLGMIHSVSDLISDAPMKALFFLTIVTVLNTSMFAITVIVMNRYGLNEALTTGILSGFRNVGLGFALVGEMLGPDLRPYIGLSMLPLFIAPVLIRVMTYRRRDLIDTAESACPQQGYAAAA